MNGNDNQPPERRTDFTPFSGSRAEALPAVDDPRVVEALEQYLAAAEGGAKPNRQAFLARHADVAGPLAECLDGLEALHAAGSSPQELSGGAALAGLFTEGQPGTPLGDFRILREIGRGGMGVVYEAVQLSLNRRVALKVLPFAAAQDAKQLQRFQNEAQAAAQLHHTNIVPVYAVGCERGVHYYAMQLIDGQTLAALIQELRQSESPHGPTGTRVEPDAEATGPYQPASAAPGAPAADTRPVPGAQLTTQRAKRAADYFRTAARQIAQAAEGLDYAHGLGIVHRDVKPANILIDVRGNVWVTDFGLAQFHAGLGLTQTGDFVGTLRYMSPEQAGGSHTAIDARTDVYSLGATLYELLTLRPIFEGTDRQTVLHQILHKDPRPPRSLDRAIPPELETIVLKAVAKAPAERYATARDFAEDLHRFLRNEPIRARRVTLAQRARKWLRRHPSVLVAGIVLLVLLAAGSLASAWLIRGEQEKTRAAYVQERLRAEEAEERFELARRAVNDMIQIAEEELADNSHMQNLRTRLLESALVYYQELIAQRREDPKAQAALEVTRKSVDDRVKKILSDLAVLQGAGQVFLLNSEAVLEDLDLSAEQRKRVTDLSQHVTEQRQKSFEAFHKLTRDERRQRFLDEARSNEAAIAEILNPEQIRRLRQITLQSRGPMAFRDRDVITALKLTAEQRTRINAIEAETFFKPEGPPSRRGQRASEPPKKARDESESHKKAHEDKRKAAMERILKVLTQEQAKKWEEMIGEPFAGPAPEFFRGPPPPFGPPR
jgi:serine/threonine protein kinase